MTRRALLTGGAGFVGSHLADLLLAHGYRVRVLDSLVPQVHGQAKRPPHLDREVELLVRDVRDPIAVRRALEDVDVVFHLAASVGVGQSMYRIADYTSANNVGTANLLEMVAARPVERLVVASSMSVYGEGLYVDDGGTACTSARRMPAQLARGDWEPAAPDGRPLHPVPTPETKPPSLESVYALSKFDQERMCLLVGNAYGIRTTALRLFNVYGTRQALSNPYTGVLAIFAARYLNGNPPLIFEDGHQRRDFVHVRDVARACLRVLDADDADGQVFNIGSGTPSTILDVAHRIGAAMGETVEPEICGEYRTGDVRHCTADIDRARRVFGYEPVVDFDDGIAELADWLAGQIAIDRVDKMRRELADRGLTV